MRALFALLALLLVVPCRADVDPALVKNLRAGGYILFMRHGFTDSTQKDSPSIVNFEDCSIQRNLTDKGRSQARSVGEHAKRLGIPVGQVLASPLCRTMETARLAFGKAEPTPAVRTADALRKMFTVTPPKGTDLVIVSHAIPMNDDIRNLTEGEIAVIKPGGDSGFSIVGRIRADQWARLK